MDSGVELETVSQTDTQHTNGSSVVVPAPGDQHQIVHVAPDQRSTQGVASGADEQGSGVTSHDAVSDAAGDREEEAVVGGDGGGSPGRGVGGTGQIAPEQPGDGTTGRWNPDGPLEPQRRWYSLLFTTGKLSLQDGCTLSHFSQDQISTARSSNAPVGFVVLHPPATKASRSQVTSLMSLISSLRFLRQWK